MKRISYLRRDVKSKQLLPPQRKCVFLIVLPINSVYNFSELHLSYSLNFATNKLLFQLSEFRKY